MEKEICDRCNRLCDSVNYEGLCKKCAAEIKRAEKRRKKKHN